MCRPPPKPASSEAEGDRQRTQRTQRLGLAGGISIYSARRAHPRLRYCTARSCFCAAAREANVPRFLRFPVFAFFFREYSRYSPDCSLRIMKLRMLHS
jgi:hypothetical protein